MWRSVLAVLFSAVATAALAVDPSPEVAAVAGYTGPDRTQRLIEGAKKEGELMVYSSITTKDQIKDELTTFDTQAQIALDGLNLMEWPHKKKPKADDEVEDGG